MILDIKYKVIANSGVLEGLASLQEVFPGRVRILIKKTMDSLIVRDRNELFLWGDVLFSKADRHYSVPLERYKEVKKLGYSSDMHGRFDKQFQHMFKTSFVDERGHWCGGKNTYVINGDVIDNKDRDGSLDDSLEMLEWLLAVQKEAKKAGGELVMILGNHELMLILFQLSYSRFIDEQVKEVGASKEAQYKVFKCVDLLLTAIIDENIKACWADDKRVFFHAGVSKRLWEETFLPEIKKLKTCGILRRVFGSIRESSVELTRVDIIDYFNNILRNTVVRIKRVYEKARKKGVDKKPSELQFLLKKSIYGELCLDTCNIGRMFGDRYGCSSRDFHPMFNIGRDRRGKAAYGGVFWVDSRETALTKFEGTPLAHHIKIAGHTYVGDKGISFYDGWVLCDVRRDCSGVISGVDDEHDQVVVVIEKNEPGSVYPLYEYVISDRGGFGGKYDEGLVGVGECVCSNFGCVIS
jgi:hypothetical protein